MNKGFFERQSCRLATISRTGYHYVPQANDDEEVVAELVAYARRRPRFGYRRAYRFVRKDRPTINHKQVQRLWQRAKLQVLPRRRRKRRRDPQRQVPRQALHPRHVITYDFMEDSTIDGRTLRILTMVDEFTRECLTLYVARSIPSAKVISVLARVVARYGAPEFIRSDNGPEFIAQVVCSWILFQDA
jgi:putative transposase